MLDRMKSMKFDPFASQKVPFRVLKQGKRPAMGRVPVGDWHLVEGVAPLVKGVGQLRLPTHLAPQTAKPLMFDFLSG